MTPVHRTVQEGLSKANQALMKPSRVKIWNKKFPLKNMLGLCYTLYIYIYDLVPKGVHENRTKEVENKVDDTLKLVVFLESAQC